jgi:hypothetical protein
MYTGLEIQVGDLRNLQHDPLRRGDRDDEGEVRTRACWKLTSKRT